MRVIIAGLLGGLIIFIWGAFAHMVLPLGEVAPGASKSQVATLFAGPQEEKKLELLAPGLELADEMLRLRIAGLREGTSTTLDLIDARIAEHRTDCDRVNG